MNKSEVWSAPVPSKACDYLDFYLESPGGTAKQTEPNVSHVPIARTRFARSRLLPPTASHRKLALTNAVRQCRSETHLDPDGHLGRGVQRAAVSQRQQSDLVQRV